MAVQVGTSGWHYEDWRGSFYPNDIRPQDMLDFYTEKFDCVEINNSFYRLPEAKTLETWHDTTPKGFLFAFKASRYITHMKKLRKTGEAMETMLSRAQTLGEKLGPMLFQLPPMWGVDRERLAAFLEELPADLRTVFEFRDPSWFADEVFELLHRHEAAFCIYELDEQRSPKEVTADLIYIRLHGPGSPYKGCYGKKELSGWAGAIASWDRAGKDVYCFFDNDERGFAAQNARELQDMLD